MNILATLAHGIELPTLSRRTGRPCRTVQTRELVLSDYDGIKIVGILDRRSAVHLSAFREVRSVQRGLIACAREMSSSSPVLKMLSKLPCALDYSTEGSRFNYYSMSVGDLLDLQGGWADGQGNIVGQLQQVGGLLVPAGDPVIAPFRQVGHLWVNGQFAMASGTAIVSFVQGRGVVFAALVPKAISDQVVEHYTRGWGDAWTPGPIDEDTIIHARNIEAACRIRPKAQDPLDAKLIKKALTKQDVDLSNWRLATTHRVKFAHQIWRNGVSRDGTQVSENSPIHGLFVSSCPSDKVHAIQK